MSSLLINTNVASLIAQRSLGQSTDKLRVSLERLSSGSRINRAADDAAGLAIAQQLRTQVRGHQQALQNVQDGLGMLDMADGGLATITENLQRMRELAVQGANDTLSSQQRMAIAQEIYTLAVDLNRVAQSTNFNGVMLLDGTTTNALIQVGDKSATITNTIDITAALASARPVPLGLIGTAPTGVGSVNTGFTSLLEIYNPTTSPATSSLLTSDAYVNLTKDLDTAISRVNSQRASVGACQNQLQAASQNLMSLVTSFQSANSRIMDTDMAAESAILAQNQVRQQAATMVLSQTNMLNSAPLRLLQD
jgi:flagellin